VAKGLIAVSDKRYGDAEKDFRAAIQITLNDPLPRYELGKVQQIRKHFDAAFATFEEIMQAMPKETAAYYYYADTAARSGQRLDQGIERINTYLLRGQVTDNDPVAVDAYLVQGRLAELVAKPDLARIAYQTALKLDPDNAAAGAALRKLD